MDPASAQPEFKFLGESLGFWVQTAVVLLGAGAAVFTIYINGKLSRAAIDHNEKLSRQRATIDLLLTQKSDASLIESKKAVSVIHSNGGDFTSLASRDKAKDGSRAHILAILNNYEFIALGIREGALDESIYKRAVYSQAVRDWGAMRAFIIELRRQNSIDTLFQEFELLARRWEKMKLKCDS
ncbi:DUF4760 domain-containing protein [Pseudomonas asiatica]|uniref:DUF4760 domain-containing protein n=1 Tax=Pseudomonas asiatica TaxID=2219225 RepID=UPI0018AA0262|nr:DUF4760 domain-containing protein [Pseudomonas asiatica]MBF8802197.1 DUF4760 domain-containing protein [Pseudomonas asiatica]